MSREDEELRIISTEFVKPNVSVVFSSNNAKRQVHYAGLESVEADSACILMRWLFRRPTHGFRQPSTTLPVAQPLKVARSRPLARLGYFRATATVGTGKTGPAGSEAPTKEPTSRIAPPKAQKDPEDKYPLWLEVNQPPHKF